MIQTWKDNALSKSALPKKNTNGQFGMDIRIIAVKKASVKSIISRQYLKIWCYLGQGSLDRCGPGPFSHGRVRGTYIN